MCQKKIGKVQVRHATQIIPKVHGRHVTSLKFYTVINEKPVSAAQYIA